MLKPSLLHTSINITLMKSKLTCLSAIAAVMLALCSCSDDDTPQLPVNTDVTFNISLPDAGRSIGQAESAVHLRCAVFNAEGTYLTTYDEGNVFADTKTANVTLQLVTGETYTVAFWVDAETSPYTITDEGTLSVDYDGALCNDDSRDAFYAARSVTAGADVVASVQLTRPFAQLNIGASDGAAYADAETSVTVINGTYSTMDLLTGLCTGSPRTVTFAKATPPEGTLTVADTEYTWMAMNYLLVDTEGLVGLTVTLTTEGYTGESTFTEVPLRRNYATNLVGAIYSAD